MGKFTKNSKGHENDCGRPGINGGYIDNHNVKFGINCYGHKPRNYFSIEAELMEYANYLSNYKRRSAISRKKVDYWKQSSK